MDKTHIYFPNLNGLRFIAAFLVMIHHIEHVKFYFRVNSYWGAVPFIMEIGKLGVILFFVLSGFLITYLLLVEEHECKSIHIKEFYIRRILRIWPLYFLIVGLAFWVIPNLSIFTLPGFGKEVVYKDFFLKVSLFVFFLPNVVSPLLGTVPYASQAWSVGTEEQYYLVWPVILKFFKRHRLSLMIVIIAVYFFTAQFLASRFSDFLPYKNVVNTFWSTFNIDCMAIGGFYAVLLFRKSPWLKFFMNRYLFYFTIIALSILMAKGVHIPYVHYDFYAALFGIVILNFAANKTIGISLENRPLNYLGKISYGLYMYHPIGIVLSFQSLKSMGFTTNWLLYPLSVVLTVLIAAVSYRYYESVFLKFKKMFSCVLSGDNAKA
jgi:peptidoglycan/LPS O-acetylase OafA/YrhL